MALGTLRKLGDDWVEQNYLGDGTDPRDICSFHGLIWHWIASAQDLQADLIDSDHVNQAVLRYIKKRGRAFATREEALEHFRDRPT